MYEMAEKDGEKPQEKSERSVEFNFDEDSGYRIVAANGVWGGITNRGDLLLDFTVDHTTVPERLEQALGEDGKLGRELRRFPPRTVTRRRQIGVLLALDDAESIARFILDKLNLVRKQAGQPILQVTVSEATKE